MEGVEANSPVLQNVTLIDTPGILSGQKQKNRNYDYESVMKWFGERADVSDFFLLLCCFYCLELSLGSYTKHLTWSFFLTYLRVKLYNTKTSVGYCYVRCT